MEEAGWRNFGKKKNFLGTRTGKETFCNCFHLHDLCLCGQFFFTVFAFALIEWNFPAGQIPWHTILKFTFTPMTIALVFMAIFTSRAWLMEWRKSAIETEQLRSEKLASQYQSLKDQLNPHFLFNSLNALSNLVYDDADRSAAFIQKLSKIYRYVLDVQQEELVDLDRELDFAKNYLELQKIRFEENLNFKLEVPNCKGYFFYLLFHCSFCWKMPSSTISLLRKIRFLFPLFK